MKSIFIVIGLICTTLILSAQDFSNLKGSKPFKISGTLGTSNTIYFSNRSVINRDPIAVSMFANLNVSVYDFDIPFSFYLTNKNTAFSHPFINFGISPKYKACRFHFGYRSLNFSPLTYNGLTFLGGGAEVDYKNLRLGFFTGTLNQANSEDMTDGNRRAPMYRRPAFGVKLGIGKSGNHLDLLFFTARDDTNSITRPLSYNLLPQENVVIGTNLRVTPFKRFMITSELAASAYNYDARSKEINFNELEPIKQFFVPRYNTALRYAGNVRATLSLGKLTTSLSYRHVQPDYYTLGSTYMINNFSSYGLDFNTQPFKSNLMVNGMFGYQSDNLTKRQLYTNQVLSYMANVIVRISNSFSINTNYNGYRMTQTDGTIPVTDSMRLDQMMHNLMVAPSLTIMRNENSHSFSLNYSLSTTDNLNPLREELSDFKTNSLGMNYSYNAKQSGINLMGNYNYQVSSSSYHELLSHTVGAGIGKKFLKEGNLGVNFNTNLSFSNVSNLTLNMVINSQLSAIYSYKKNHNANLRIAFNNSNNRSVMGQYNFNGSEIIIGMGYTYRFAPAQKTDAKK